MDADGYGYKSDDRGVERLLEDIRTLSPVGIERVARGWNLYGHPAHSEFQAAEKAALHAIEAADLGLAWEALRRQVLDLTEGRSSLISWKAEHGEVGHHGEAAALGAALALHAGAHLDQGHRALLLRPMAEALPWLTDGEDSSAADRL
ncbi:MAG: hypothetical protein QOE92_1778 [Chloroflexota bacterium]|jgi:hypothetical protein|nr:hypothetical protein [Chloroflexota bacterium]